MIIELQLHNGNLLAVGDLSWEEVPHNGDRLVVKGEPSFYKTHDTFQRARFGGNVDPESMWYGRVRVCSRKFVKTGKGQAALELLVEDLAASEAFRGETDWSEPDKERDAQAKADVERMIEKHGSLERATVYYLNEAMRAARSNLRRYAPLMLEIEEILRRNGFER